MPQLNPTIPNLRWGPRMNQRMAILKHPVRDNGGNPWIVYRHGGGSTDNDNHLPFLADKNGNGLAWYLNNRAVGPNDMHFDWISVESEQAGALENLGGDRHLNQDRYRWRNTVRNRPTFFPYGARSMQVALCYIKSRSKTLGLNPDMGAIMGTSYGSTVACCSQLMEPLKSGDLKSNPRNRYDLEGGYDSRVRAVIGHQFLVDERSSYHEAPRRIIVSNLTYTENAAARLFQLAHATAGTLAGFQQDCAGGQINVISGTGANIGTYNVQFCNSEGVADNANYMWLDRSIGSAANSLTDITITFQGYPQRITIAGGAFNNAAKTLTKTDAFVAFGQTGDRIVFTSGTGVAVSEALVLSRTNKDTIVIDRDIGGSNPGDVGALLSGDFLHWDADDGKFGMFTASHFDHPSMIGVRRQTSLLDYIERGQLQFLPPLLGVYEVTGTHVKPYGLNVVAGGGDYHDDRMMDEMLATAARFKIPFSRIAGYRIQGTWRDSDPNQNAWSEGVYQWLVSAMTRNVPSGVSIGSSIGS